VITSNVAKQTDRLFVTKLLFRYSVVSKQTLTLWQTEQVTVDRDNYNLYSTDTHTHTHARVGNKLLIRALTSQYELLAIRNATAKVYYPANKTHSAPYVWYSCPRKR
jgi:hypothetical protein